MLLLEQTTATTRYSFLHMKGMHTFTTGLALLVMFAALLTREYLTAPLAGTQLLQLAIFVRM
jgi:hypothetical protein